MSETETQRLTGGPRKRSKESVSSIQSDVPASKRKKMASKEKATVNSVKQTVSSTSPASPQLPAALPDQNEVDEEAVGVASPAPRPGSVAEVPGSSAGAVATKKKVPKNRYLKPQRLSPGSWMAHMASLLVHRCVQRAEACGLDPRDHLTEINWSKMMDGLFQPQDLHLIWYFIRREYSERAIPEILEATRPYSELSVENLLREEIRVKYKDAIPKNPLTPYMLFMKSKQPKLKQKYPNLQMTEVAAKIGKKWSALPEERKEKYKQQHAMLKASYEAKLKSFYDEHPDARPPPKQPAPSKSKKAASKAAVVANTETEEEKKIKELKALLPKHPLSAYLHFCKKKREKLHQKHPELAPNAVTVKLGKRWKSMDTEARTKYIKLHEESVRQYKEDLARFNSEHPEAQELLAKAKKTKGKRNAKVTAAKQQTLSFAEESKPAVASPASLITTVQPTTTTTATATTAPAPAPPAAAAPPPAAAGDGERDEKEEEAVEEEEVAEEVEDEEEEDDVGGDEGDQQNGGSASDSESSGSSTED